MRFWKMKALSYLSGIYVYRWYGLAVAWVFCLVGWSTIAVVPDQYKAAAKVYIDTQSIMDPLLRGLTVSLDPQQEIAVMLKTLITRPTVEQVIRLTEPNANGLTAPQLEQEVQRLQSSISITQLETKNYYEISYVDRDGSTATGVAQALLSILQNNKIGNTRLNMDDARSFISKQIDDYENRLREADKRREDFRTANLDILGKANAANRIDVADGLHDQAVKEYNAAVARRDSVKAQLENTPKTVAADSRIFLGPTITGPIMAGGATVPIPAGNLKQRLQQAETVLDELRSKYTENHPDVISEKKLIAKLQEEMSGPKEPEEPSSPPVMIPNPVYVQLQARFSDEEATVAVQRQRMEAATRDLQTSRGEASRAIETLTKFNQLDRDYGNTEATYKQLLQSREFGGSLPGQGRSKRRHLIPRTGATAKASVSKRAKSTDPELDRAAHWHWFGNGRGNFADAECIQADYDGRHCGFICRSRSWRGDPHPRIERSQKSIGYGLRRRLCRVAAFCVWRSDGVLPDIRAFRELWRDRRIAQGFTSFCSGGTACLSRRIGSALLREPERDFVRRAGEAPVGSLAADPMPKPIHRFGNIGACCGGAERYRSARIEELKPELPLRFRA